MDIKIEGIIPQILKEALAQAKKARFEILDLIEATIPTPRTQLALTAPKIGTVETNVDKVKIAVGEGGETIDKIIEGTGIEIDIDNGGSASIYSSDQAAIDRTKEITAGLVREVKVGEVYHAKVVRIEKFGAFVNLFDETDALIHILGILWSHTASVSDVLEVGEEVDVKVIKAGDKGRVDASMEVLSPRPPRAEEEHKGHSPFDGHLRDRKERHDKVD